MKIRIGLILLIVYFITSCDDIFVKNISNEEVTINCPNDAFKGTSTKGILFWWENIDGATGYNLQIVTPDFDNITNINLDVSLDSNKSSIILPAGEYQWRIRGFNDSYSTKYIIRTISVIDNK